MVQIREIVNKFLIAYTENDSDTLSKLLSDNIKINFSNISSHEGKQDVLNALKWNELYDIKRVTTTNYFSYRNDTCETVGLMAHHLLAYEKNNELFPLVFGGKYVFQIDTASEAIQEINFVLEYQAENTIYVKGKWKLSTGHNDYTPISDFHTETILENALSAKDINSIVNLFFWCLDTGDIKTLHGICDKTFTISRDQSVGHDKFVSDLASLEQYIEDTNHYYHLNQNSIRILSAEQGDCIIVTAQHLTPQRLGTKKLNSATKYHSFFDEDIVVTLQKDTYKIMSVTMSKAADVFYNGFRILEY